MKRLILYVFLSFLSLCSVFGQNDTILSLSFIRDSLCLNSGTYVLYKDRTIETAFSFEQTPTFFVVDKNDKPLEEFILEIKELTYNCLDTTLIISGIIQGVEEDPFLPAKNVNLFIGSNFRKKYGMIYRNITVSASRFVDYGEPTDSFPKFILNNWKHDFAQLKKGCQPTLQTFNCKLNIDLEDNYLIFACYGYKLKVFDLKNMISPDK